MVRVLARSAPKVDTVLQELFPDESLLAELKKNVTVVEGSATNHATLLELLKDTSVVMSFLGMVKSPEWVVQPGVEAIMGAMRTMPRPPKFLSMSSITLGDSRAQGLKAWGQCVACLVMRCFLKACFEDLQAAEDFIIGNRGDLNVIICRASVLADKKDYLQDFATGGARKGYALLKADEMQGITNYVDRQHVAQAFLDLCEDSSRYDFGEVSIFDAPAE